MVEFLQYEDYMRLLRLTVPSCFDKRRYSNGYHIASGAFGAVMGVTYEGNELAVKILEKSRNECDNPHLTEVYTEVSILEICKGDRRVTQLFDYGCSGDSYYIVMENYPTTLKAWRKSFIAPGISTQLDQVSHESDNETNDENENKNDENENEKNDNKEKTKMMKVKTKKMIMETKTMIIKNRLKTPKKKKTKTTMKTKTNQTPSSTTKTLIKPTKIPTV